MLPVQVMAVGMLHCPAPMQHRSAYDAWAVWVPVHCGPLRSTAVPAYMFKTQLHGGCKDKGNLQLTVLPPSHGQCRFCQQDPWLCMQSLCTGTGAWLISPTRSHCRSRISAVNYPHPSNKRRAWIKHASTLIRVPARRGQSCECEGRIADTGNPFD